jgi:hypothetical protein
MSNDMKLIMESWRGLIDEVSVRDTPGDIDHGVGADVLMFVAEVLDPTGISSWKYLEQDLEEYMEAVKAQKDPYELKNMYTNLVNGFGVALSLVDGIPLITYAVRPLKLLRMGRRGFRKLTKKLVKVDPKLAKASDDIAKKLSRAENVARRKVGDKSLAQIIFMGKLPSIDKLTLGVFAAYGALLIPQIVGGLISRKEGINRLKLLIWLDYMDSVFKKEGVLGYFESDVNLMRYLAPIQRASESWTEERVNKAPNEEWERLEKLLISIPDYIYVIMGYKDKNDFVTYLEREAAKQFNRDVQKYRNPSASKQKSGDNETQSYEMQPKLDRLNQTLDRETREKEK